MLPKMNDLLAIASIGLEHGMNKEYIVTMA